ncbi:MAG: PQQ-dependent sugar dehydrogenase [Gemmatimonadota bacterium]|nr:PQQ-dependent sugar dehydrogenase [Gemmatimonadota bacterium]
MARTHPPRIASILLASALLAGCGDGGGTPPSSNGQNGVEVRLERIASGLDFPLYVTAPPDDPRLFVVEKTGRILVRREGRILEAPFLDLSGLVSGGSEQGLLSLAFHPDYAANGRFFVNYTDRAGDTRVVEYGVSADPDRADPDPVRTVLAVEQPFSNHNGGLALFGPDGMLYVGMGDGGSAGDPRENGQDTSTLLGALLRLDVDGGDPYAIPADNPLVEEPGARGEIWAWGLRNPWRFAFDRASGDLYIADVGQNEFEEVNAVAGAGRGLNYGWDVMEATHCFEPDEGCDRSGLTLPVVEYDHGEGCSVTGGFVYRGEAIPALRGTYFYSDFCSGFVRSFRLSGGEAVDERRWPGLEPDGGRVGSFGVDAAGELYITTARGGVFEIVPGP